MDAARRKAMADIHDLMIYIPTYRRVDRQITLSGLPLAWKDRTTLVCPADERKELSKLFPRLHAIVTPNPDIVPNIAAKRAWIFRHAGRMNYKKILMFDDDLQFYSRYLFHPGYDGYGQGDPKKWAEIIKANRQYGASYRANPMQMDEMLHKVEEMLTVFAHGGISQKFMNHTKGSEWSLNTKATHALAYQTDVVLQNCKLNQTRMFEDLDYTLQLLAKGYGNACYNWGSTNDPKGFNAPGGESLCRKMKDISVGADRMEELHPGIVKAVSRKNLTDAAMYGGKRIIVAWKKAAELGGVP
jgi:hypothetical protein